MRHPARIVLGVLALGGVAAEVAAVDAGAAPGSAVLDLAAGWALLAAAAGADALRPACRVLVATAAGLWFAGTLGSVGGDVGRVADLWASLYSAPLAGALLAAPAAWPRGDRERALVAWTWLRGLVPAVAAASAVTLATGAALAAVGFGRREHDRRAALAHRASFFSRGDGPGLRGGTFRTDFDQVWTSTLDRAHWTEDVAVSGTLHWSFDGGPLDADLQVDGPGRRDGTLHLEGGWLIPGAPRSITITGTLGGRRVAATVPAG